MAFKKWALVNIVRFLPHPLLPRKHWEWGE